MRNLKNELKYKTINYNKLIEYGFVKKNEKYIYEKTIFNNEFKMTVDIENDIMTSRLIDLQNEEEYILVDVQDSTGEFVGTLRTEYETELEEILDMCTDKDVFKNNQSKEIINYVQKKYKDNLEFLWEKFDDTAIIRNKQNQKWYAVLMNVGKSKFGIELDEKTEVIDLRYQKGKVEEIVDSISIFPGYHMNKKSWITIILDGSLETNKIIELIDNSYQISCKK